MFLVASPYRAGTALPHKSRGPDYFVPKYCAYSSSSYLAWALPSHPVVKSLLSTKSKIIFSMINS
jgi:hypothetical protein